MRTVLIMDFVFFTHSNNNGKICKQNYASGTKFQLKIKVKFNRGDGSNFRPSQEKIASSLRKNLDKENLKVIDFVREKRLKCYCFVVAIDSWLATGKII